MSRERGVLFNSEMVKALLDGSKTQTRRPLKIQPYKDDFKAPVEDGDYWVFHSDERYSYKVKAPLGKVGDLIYCRETMVCERELPERLYFDALYSADRTHYDTPVGSDDQTEWFMNYRNWWSAGEDKVVIPSVHMPKWAARIWHKITGVRCERICDISEPDAQREGSDCDYTKGIAYVDGFAKIWESCYPGSIRRNDHVFVYDIERCGRPE